MKWSNIVELEKQKEMHIAYVIAYLMVIVANYEIKQNLEILKHIK